MCVAREQGVQFMAVVVRALKSTRSPLHTGMLKIAKTNFVCRICRCDDRRAHGIYSILRCVEARSPGKSVSWKQGSCAAWGACRGKAGQDGGVC